MIRHALLTLLADGADHGYRLRRRLGALLGPVWKVNAGQVYRALDQLRRASWVEELPPDVERGGGHERWPVAITAAGAAELLRWLDLPIVSARTPAPRRSEILARLAVGGWPSIPRVLEGIEAEQRAFLLARDRIEQEQSRLGGEPTPAGLAAFLALEASRLEIEAHITWLDVCREHLQRRTRGSDPSSGC